MGNSDRARQVILPRSPIITRFLRGDNISGDDGTDADTLRLRGTGEWTPVSFSGSGLEAGATGSVMFADTTDHQAVVNTAANNTSSADLSARPNGTNTSLLSSAESNGLSSSAANSGVSPDTDSSAMPSLSVDATNPAQCHLHGFWT